MLIYIATIQRTNSFNGPSAFRRPVFIFKTLHKAHFNKFKLPTEVLLLLADTSFVENALSSNYQGNREAKMGRPEKSKISKTPKRASNITPNATSNRASHSTSNSTSNSTSTVTSAELAEAKRYIRSSGSGVIIRSYFKETHCSVENTEIDSKGLYCFEKLIRLAFVQSMKDDFVLGQQEGFIAYIAGLSENFESPHVTDWRPEQSAVRIADFILSFYNLYLYQWKKHGRLADKSLARFMEIARECLDFGYIKLSDKFENLPKDIKDTVNKAFFLTNSRIDEWHEERTMEISPA